MADTKHTPGPWRLETVEEGAVRHLCPVDGDDMSILTVVVQDGAPFAAVYSDDDARLIAAAPDLLAALRGCVSLLDMLPDAGAPLDRARAAIAAATGEAAHG